jgi:hypothetical protein
MMIANMCSLPTLSACGTCLQALYRGNGANVLRLLPEVGFKFVVHDQFKVTRRQSTRKASSPFYSPPHLQQLSC